MMFVSGKKKLTCLSNQEAETVLCNLSDKSLPTNRLS